MLKVVQELLPHFQTGLLEAPAHTVGEKVCRASEVASLGAPFTVYDSKDRQHILGSVKLDGEEH